jgi:hypothetical protein
MEIVSASLVHTMRGFSVSVSLCMFKILRPGATAFWVPLVGRMQKSSGPSSVPVVPPSQDLWGIFFAPILLQWRKLNCGGWGNQRGAAGFPDASRGCY